MQILTIARIGLALFAFALMPFRQASAQHAPLSETVQFAGAGLTLSGQLVRPDGAGPFPAVVALHGCGGLGSRSDVLNARHRDWAERLRKLGYIVLFPDSFGSRGAGSQCRTDDRVTRPSRERVDDAIAAKLYLQSRRDVRPDAISLLGWSNGGSTVLYAVQNRERSQSAGVDFAKAIAFYPGCRLPRERGWRPRPKLPLLILMGDADDWTPAEPCKAIAADASAQGLNVSIVTYPGAYHDFDHPNLSVHVNEDLAYTGNGEGVAHTGTDPVARADAIKRVTEFLAR